MVKKKSIVRAITFWGVVIICMSSLGILSVTASCIDSKPAPDFLFNDLDGKQVRLSDYRGKIVILNFWADWCPPCKRELPDLVELYQEYKEKGLVIIGIAINSNTKKVKKIVLEKGITYPVVIGDYDITLRYGGIRAIPTTFIIDPEGNIFKKRLGATSKEIFEQDIKPFLN